MTYNDLLQELLKLKPEQLKQTVLAFPPDSYVYENTIPLDSVIELNTVKHYCSDVNGEEVDITSHPEDGLHHPENIVLFIFRS